MAVGTGVVVGVAGVAVAAAVGVSALSVATMITRQEARGESSSPGEQGCALRPLTTVSCGPPTAMAYVSFGIMSKSA